MPYRDELDAARQRITALQGEVDRLRFSHNQRQIDELEARIVDLEAALHQEESGGDLRARNATCFGPAIAVAALFALAFALVTRSSEAGAWESANAAILVGLVAPGWSWGRARRLAGGAIAALFKTIVLAVWAWDFWAPTPGRLVKLDSSLGGWDADFYFFWFAPAFVFAVALIEGAVLYLLLRPQQSGLRPSPHSP